RRESLVVRANRHAAANPESADSTAMDPCLDRCADRSTSGSVLRRLSPNTPSRDHPLPSQRKFRQDSTTEHTSAAPALPSRRKSVWPCLDVPQRLKFGPTPRALADCRPTTSRPFHLRRWLLHSDLVS